MPNQPEGKPKLDILIRPMAESDLPVVNHVMRLAFGTFLGMPEPLTFMGDTDYAYTRWKANPTAAFCAESNGELVGSNYASNWGSVGFFGPLTTHPKVWEQGVAQRLIEPVMECFNIWGTKQAGLLTFAESIKHVSLYQKFGFFPRFLTAIMSKPVENTSRELQWSKFSDIPLTKRPDILADCRKFTDSIYEGLDVSIEIMSVAMQNLGDTVLLWDDGQLIGLAVCHCGPGSEAGSGVCYIKFGASRSGPVAERDFNNLITACEKLAFEKGLLRLTGGANTARHEAYKEMLKMGFKTNRQNIIMHRPNEPGYNRPGVFLIDDWR